MITVDTTNSEFIAYWVMAQVGARLVAPFWAIGFLVDGELRAGVVFNGWNGSNLDVTIAGKGMVTRRTIRALYSYAWGLGARRITARLRVTNKPMLAIVERLGFVYEGLAPDYYPDAHALVYRALRDECSWLRGPHGRPRTCRPEGDRRGPDGDEQGNGHHSAWPEFHEPGHALWQPDLFADWDMGRRDAALSGDSDVFA